MLVKVPVILTFDLGVNGSEVAEAMAVHLAERAAKTIQVPDLTFEIGNAEAVTGETIRQSPRSWDKPRPKGRTGGADGIRNTQRGNESG